MLSLFLLTIGVSTIHSSRGTENEITTESTAEPLQIEQVELLAMGLAEDHLLSTMEALRLLEAEKIISPTASAVNAQKLAYYFSVFKSTVSANLKGIKSNAKKTGKIYFVFNFLDMFVVIPTLAASGSKWAALFAVTPFPAITAASLFALNTFIKEMNVFDNSLPSKSKIEKQFKYLFKIEWADVFPDSIRGLRKISEMENEIKNLPNGVLALSALQGIKVTSEKIYAKVLSLLTSSKKQKKDDQKEIITIPPDLQTEVQDLIQVDSLFHELFYKIEKLRAQINEYRRTTQKRGGTQMQDLPTKSLEFSLLKLEKWYREKHRNLNEQKYALILLANEINTGTYAYQKYKLGRKSLELKQELKKVNSILEDAVLQVKKLNSSGNIKYLLNSGTLPQLQINILSEVIGLEKGSASGGNAKSQSLKCLFSFFL